MKQNAEQQALGAELNRRAMRHAMDADQPRASNGQFGSGGGGAPQAKNKEGLKDAHAKGETFKTAGTGANVGSARHSTPEQNKAHSELSSQGFRHVKEVPYTIGDKSTHVYQNDKGEKRFVSPKGQITNG